MEQNEMPIPQPPEPPKKRRGRASVKAKKDGPADKLIASLKFISPAQKRSGSTREQFCFFSGGWVCASNDVLTLGTKVEGDLHTCPQTHLLLDALNKVEGDLSIIQLPNDVLAVASGEFRGMIPCVATDALNISAPDSPCAAVDDRLKEALALVAPACDDKHVQAVKASVLLQAGTVVGTNGFMCIEAFHGIDLPPGIVMPKQAALAVSKCKKPLVSFGFTESSVTFWFEDESFIKTQLYDVEYPDYANRLFGEFDDYDFEELPEEFFKAVKAIKSFAKEAVYFKNGAVLSNAEEETASLYKIDLLPDDLIFNPKYLLAAEKAMKQVYFADEPDRLFFHSDKARGVIAAMAERAPEDND